MASSKFTNEDILANFDAGKGTATAEQVFKEVLKGFSDKGLLLRQKVSQTDDVFNARKSQRHSEDTHAIFQYRIDYIIERHAAVIIYRTDGTKDLSQIAFALLDDTTGFYQPIGVAELIRLLEKMADRNALKSVVIRANEALNRVLATGRSMDAK